MSALRYGPSCEPSRDVFAGPEAFLVALGIERTPEPTHNRCPGGEHMPGVIGGWDCPCECHRRPAPYVLWKQAAAEYPDDIDAQRRRYRELMIEHGHLIPGEPKPLPCGWSPSQTSTDVDAQPDASLSDDPACACAGSIHKNCAGGAS